MAWSYRKRIKVIPGVHLNFSKKGISTSIGVKGASINFSKSGTTVSTTVLGFSNRYKISNTQSRSKYNPTPSQPNVPINESYFPDENIFSADIHEITSQNMQGIKEAIILAGQQKNELTSDLRKIIRTLSVTKTKKILSYIFLYGFINKDIPKNSDRDIKSQQEAIDQTRKMIEKCYVNLEIDFDHEIKRKFEKVYETFQKLTASRKIWDITSARFQDRVAMRSSASTIVSRREVHFSLKTLPYIKSDYQALYMKNANGADIYIYPTFIVMYTNENNFAIIGINELNFRQTYTRFTETSTVPADTKIISKTWAKVNKNGTPDRRFKSNYQIPVVRYGNIRLTTQTGLHEEYEFSNYELTEEFGKAFNEFQSEFR
ncbi:DUF4236 domain-containing protein [Chryseobacterium joostei]|uniref:DUF4236 domain-containing protein n=1 Tax=Chryseobacterium joostei TaxID=112234 RepID=A0A1N7ISN3_9FLAO|nr:DUF4236 domain-containing protein [Chryseobacterium joostei]AZA98242.1 DUF4236 domain-containing protein [Chryseobacterium joostei]SIS40105.1 Protein of unknown function [Chryseobacterium joostei]